MEDRHQRDEPPACESNRSYSGVRKKRSEVKRVPLVFFMKFVCICHLPPVAFVLTVIKFCYVFVAFI